MSVSRSPEEIAHDVLEEFYLNPWTSQNKERILAAAIRAYGDARAAEERERCASVANACGQHTIAAVIREAKP